MPIHKLSRCVFKRDLNNTQNTSALTTGWTTRRVCTCCMFYFYENTSELHSFFRVFLLREVNNFPANLKVQAIPKGFLM